MMTRYDNEIRALEEQISRERAGVARQSEALMHAAKCAAVSPKGLLVASVIGFMLSEFTRPRHHYHHSANSGVPSKLGVGGIVGGIALAVIRAQYGSPLAFGRAMWRYAAAKSAARNAIRSVSETRVDRGGLRSAAPPARDRDFA